MIELAQQIGGPVAVIGDVHGQIDEMRIIADKLRGLPDYDQRWIVFLGDLVDRGPDPKGAVDLFLELLEEHPRTTCVSGNHELAMAGATGLINAPAYTGWPERWLSSYSADTTFDSYGVAFGDLASLSTTLPQAHRDLFRNLPWCVEHPEYLFVHAGLKVDLPFAAQLQLLRERDFTMNRPEWLCSKSLVGPDVPVDCPLIVASGHVRRPEVEFYQQRILLDTTGGTGGDLSCVLLPENLVLTSGSTMATIGMVRSNPVEEAPQKPGFWRRKR